MRSVRTLSIRTRSPKEPAAARGNGTRWSALALTLRVWQGRLGHGDETHRLLPCRVRGEGMVGRRVLMAALGGMHTAVVMEDGDMCTWGYGEDGALGHPRPYRPGFRDFAEKEKYPAPTRIPAERFEGEQVSMAACGLGFTGAVTRTGRLFMWGLGRYGIMGQSNTRDARLPVPVPAELFGGRRVELIGAGHFHCAAVVVGGDVYTWGYGGWGALGLGHKADQHAPSLVTSLQGQRIVIVACGEAHTLGVTRQGGVFSWGHGERGRLGHGDEEEHVVPAQVVGFARGQRTVTAAAGGGHSVMVMQDGSCISWGKGQALGLEGHQDTLCPTLVSPQYFDGEPVAMAAAGRNHTLVVTVGGRVFAWGLGGEGRLGLGDDAWRFVPAPVCIEPHYFVGRFRRLPACHALSFAMVTHPRLGAESIFAR